MGREGFCKAFQTPSPESLRLPALAPDPNGSSAGRIEPSGLRCERRVEDVSSIGKYDVRDAHYGKDSLDLPDVSRVNETRYHVQFAAGLALLRKALGDGLDGIVVACDVRSNIARCIGDYYSYFWAEGLLFFDLFHGGGDNCRLWSQRSRPY